MGAAILQKCGPARNCTVRLSELTPFKWDKMFYFDYGVAPSDRRRAIGNSLSTHELERQVVFLRDGKIIDNEFLPTDVEKPIGNQIVFETDGSDKPMPPPSRATPPLSSRRNTMDLELEYHSTF